MSTAPAIRPPARTTRRAPTNHRADELQLHVAAGVGVRLVGAPAHLRAAVRRELGGDSDVAPESSLEITCVERLSHGPLTWLGATGEAFAFDGRAFYLVSRRGALARLDLAHPESTGIELECSAERVPLLIELLGLRFLARGLVLAHASAFVIRDHGVLAAGWQSGGKTELLLAALSRGAAYVADEWTAIDPAGRMHGVASTVQLWAWQLAQLPEVARRLPTAERRRLGILRSFRAAIRPLLAGRRRGSSARSLRQLADWIDNANRLEATVDALFEARTIRAPVPIERVLLASTSPGPTRVSNIDPGAVAARMAASLQYERSRLLRAYAQFRYAFPDARSELIEASMARERDLLAAALRERAADELVHPYPARLTELAEAMEQLVG